MTTPIFNPEHRHPGLIFDNVVYNAPDIQSIGGMVQTMLLAATELGLGTLQICDILYAYPAIRDCLRRDEELVTAMSLGLAADTPAPPPARRDTLSPSGGTRGKGTRGAPAACLLSPRPFRGFFLI